MFIAVQVFIKVDDVSWKSMTYGDQADVADMARKQVINGATVHGLKIDRDWGQEGTQYGFHDHEVTIHKACEVCIEIAQEVMH